MDNFLKNYKEVGAVAVGEKHRFVAQKGTHAEYLVMGGNVHSITPTMVEYTNREYPTMVHRLPIKYIRKTFVKNKKQKCLKIT